MQCNIVINRTENNSAPNLLQTAGLKWRNNLPRFEINGSEDRPREPRESPTTAVTRAYGTFPAVLAKFSNNTYVMILSATHRILVGD